MGTSNSHCQKLAAMYNQMPFNKDLEPQMSFITLGECKVEAAVNPLFFHGGGIIHGSIIFRLLDDACTFAAWSYVEDKLCVTKNLHIHYQSPINEGTMQAYGKVLEISQTANEITVEGVMMNQEKEVARCTAVIARMSAKVKKMF
jgi:uncharacterized protein (TIGR00369 family)